MGCFMKNLLIVLIYFFFFGCSGGNNGGQLKQEVLEKAGECGDDIRREYEDRIKEQEQILNSDQLLQSLKKMKELIRC